MNWRIENPTNTYKKINGMIWDGLSKKIGKSFCQENSDCLAAEGCEWFWLSNPPVSQRARHQTAWEMAGFPKLQL